jgi:lactoylglutathione lyase
MALFTIIYHLKKEVILIKVLAVDHITINCCNIKETFNFYENVLGLSRIDTIDMGDHVLHLYQLPGAKLELIEYKNEQKLVNAGNTDVGVYRHFAIRVDDIEEVRKRCEKAGIGINLEPTAIQQFNGQVVMLIVDPNGVEIEIMQA